ncbi:putative mitochondrial protein cyt-4 protein [Phaeoacremonium minimum UCRPA7]|uniref:Putative mitochondrial protein cyt-4 protein n=1 Tax=Phaeoacremonium minimum (strain UCR-PA7) TaxID=1286976 RepID=R8BC21_PHAM7|nr:putative mitochondrial protein cyt-4 protein [Phaeoacremonium minimum UCRPA7]EON96852.1 putative mitochondrial protein cyt-4 protein [Phaeoacremonium minimum UCRPA7]
MLKAASSRVVTRNPSSFINEVNDDGIKEDRPLFDGDDLVDLRADAVQLQAGDLVEVTSDTLNAQALAICLGRFNGAEHFYTNTGKWFTSHGIRTLFTVNNFVDAAELQPVIDALPARDTPMEVLNALQDMRQGPSRNTGSFLIRKMLDFSVESEVIHQTHAARLDNASEFLGQTEQYLSLEEIADILLPSAVKADGKFPPAALYAVHKTLMVNDAAFRPMTPIGNRRSYLYEISSLSDVQLVDKMNSLMRMFYDDAQLYGGSLKPSRLGQSQLGRFILKAREAIDSSREFRKWSPHGMLGPAVKFSKPHSIEWTDSDVKILHFMQLWSSFRKFSRASSLHWIGAGILRAIERYDESEYLTTTTGWTFLQEIGWIPPWDISSRYSLRLPGVGLKRTGGFLGQSLTGDGGLRQGDPLARLRKDWTRLRAYCIDAANASDIDDAVSIEWTPEGEQWVHIHVADPASGMAPDSLLAKRAELVPQTAYLPGHFERMLPVAAVRTKFSLAPDRPCLTFSARVDDEGQIQEYKIAPGTLRDVVYITGKDVNEPLAAVNLSSLQTFTRDVLYPKLAAGERPSETDWRTMRSLLGSDEISATPAPHFTMGLSMYTKATSPLRRFSDLLVHWQVEAALLEEERRGTSLVGNTDDDSFLPFTRERLERSVLPMLRVRERTMRALDDGDGNAEWMLQALVRAWHFGEAALPKTFRFTVADVLARRAVRGRLNWFDRPALMAIDGLNALGIQLSELETGEVLDVELVDVNVVEKSILVRAVGKAAIAEGEAEAEASE